MRHNFITNLRNAPLRVAQSLARHKSSAMTDRYTHIRLHDERAALETLPDLSQPSKLKQEAAATGTYDKPVDSTDTTDKSLSKSCFSHAPIRSNTDNSGKKNPDSVDKTALCVSNEGAVQMFNTMTTYNEHRIYNPVALRTGNRMFKTFTIF